MKEPRPGRAETLTDNLRRVLAPNPGPMTYLGTNTFIVGRGTVAVVDPGPDDAFHLAALLEATEGEAVAYILITHAHLDHSALARRLSDKTGAPIAAFGPPEAGRSETMERLAADGVGGGEGVDRDFAPDISLRDGESVGTGDWSLTAIHTPGHFAGHLAFDLGDGTALSGDHVMSWSSSLVSPPDGDVSDFRATSERLRDRAFHRLYPAHGPALESPKERLEWLLSHRQNREDAVLAALKHGPSYLPELTARIYADIPAAMQPAAARNLLAHLIDLHQRGRVTVSPAIGLNALWSLT